MRTSNGHLVGPQGGEVNYITGQVRENSTDITTTDGPETWIPMILSGGLLRKAGTAVIESATAKGESEIVYRVFGGEAGSLGKSWTPINPNSIANYRNAAGLPNVKTGRFVIEGTVEKSNILLKRAALRLDGNNGGIMEYIIKDPSKIKVTRVSGVNPQF